MHCPACWPSRRRESALPRLEPPRALVHMLEHMWCKEGRSGVRERAAGGGSEADERLAPGTGSWEQFHGLRRRRPPQRAPSTGGAKALAQSGLMLDICGGASQHSTADGTREVIATDRLSSVWALRMSRFRGVQVDLVNVPNICCIKAPNLYVSSAKSARARNSKSEGCFCRISYGVPSEVPRKLRADRAPGRRFGFLGK